MTSSSGNSSSGSPQLQNSGSVEDMRNQIDQRKRKRMQSNRESARRSRTRKLKQLDDLMAQAAELRKENDQISTNLNVITQHFVNVEAENSVVRAQMIELNQRLNSLDEILNFINCSAARTVATVARSSMFEAEGEIGDGLLNMNPWNFFGLYQQPIMASAEMFDY